MINIAGGAKFLKKNEVNLIIYGKTGRQSEGGTYQGDFFNAITHLWKIE